MKALCARCLITSTSVASRFFIHGSESHLDVALVPLLETFEFAFCADGESKGLLVVSVEYQLHYWEPSHHEIVKTLTN